MSVASETLSIEAAQELVAQALTRSNVSAANAASVARALVAAEVDGQGGHGLSRVVAYAGQARSGKVDGNAVPRIEKVRPAVLAVDAGHGFAFPAIDAALEALVPLARETGLAAASFSRSHHAGQLGAHVERLADAGLIGLMVSNTPKAMAPWGGAAPLYGTNPIAFAAPMNDAAPLVIDLSLSKVARGKVMAAAQRGEAIPEGWALDASGAATTDPAAALKGTMVPAGDAKGAALALMVEVLSAAFTGANPSSAASSFFDADGPPPGIGHLLIALAPDAAADGFAARMTALAVAATMEPGTRLPGTSRLERRRAAKELGIAVSPAMLEAIRAL